MAPQFTLVSVLLSCYFLVFYYCNTATNLRSYLFCCSPCFLRFTLVFVLLISLFLTITLVFVLLFSLFLTVYARICFVILLVSYDSRSYLFCYSPCFLRFTLVFVLLFSLFLTIYARIVLLFSLFLTIYARIVLLFSLFLNIYARIVCYSPCFLRFTLVLFVILLFPLLFFSNLPVRDEPTHGPRRERRGAGGVHGIAGDGRGQSTLQAWGERATEDR